MELHLLGTIEATLNGRPIPLGATKQRAVLVMLALQANATVSVDRLVDGLWGEVPPATAPKMVQLYVSQLRRLLGGDGAQIVTHGRGYELRVAPEAIDAARFERLVDEAGRSARAPNDAAREALALWHGAALADVAGEPFAAAEIRRLDELWLRAAELAVEGDVAAGRDEDALAQLERLVEEHPLRERLHAQRMLALYRSGRQADALEAYAAARRRLVDEVGVEPSAELRELQARILRQDPSLRLPPAPAETQPAEREEVPDATKPPARGARAQPVGSTRRRRLVPAAAAAILVGIAVFAVTRLTGAEPLSGIDGGAVGVIDPQAAAVTAQYRTGSDPGAVAQGAGSVWVASPREGTVSRIHRGTDRLETIDVGPAPTGLAFGGGSLWVAGGDDGAVAQVDPGANRVLQRIPIGNGLRAVTVGYGALWAATALDGEVVRIDLRSGRITKRIAVGGQPAALATGAGSVWAAAEESGTVGRIDPRSGDVLDAIPVGNGPAAVAVGLGAVWIANRQDGTVSRIDPATDRVTETVPAGGSPVALTIADHALWVADASGAVLRLDPRTGTIAGTVRTGSTPVGLAAVDGSIWVTAVAPPAAHRGGTLRVGGSIVVDPALGAYGDAPALQLAYEGLVAYRRQGGPAGARLVGGLAADVPKPTDGGRRYVFRLHRGLRYSNGTPVRAGDFRASVERASLLARGPGIPFPDTIEGMARCRTATRSCDLSRGISADERAGTITIRLRRADPELLEKLAAPLLSVMPSATPRRGLTRTAPAGTGPYRVRRIVPGRQAVLTRNPHFRPRGPDSRPAGFADRIEVTSGGERAQVAAAERGRLDLASVFASATSEQLAALRTRVGTRVRSATAPFTEYAWLNVKAPPFNDPRVRRALNLAVDRARVVDLTGGPDAGSPACQLLPPGLPGYRPICPFTAAPSPAGAWTAPDRTEAKRLVAASGTRGTAVEVWGWGPRRTVARHLVKVLRDLGFRSRLRVFGDLGLIIDAAQDPRQRPQIGIDGWIADNPEPAAFLNALISCHGYAANTKIPNLSRFCDRSIDAAIDRARAAGAGADAAAAWQRIERRIAKRAPVVPLTTRRSVVITSKRVGNVQFHPFVGVLLDQVWVR
jgi:YVTN family beta-propeller protein